MLAWPCSSSHQGVGSTGSIRPGPPSQSIHSREVECAPVGLAARIRPHRHRASCSATLRYVRGTALRTPRARVPRMPWSMSCPSHNVPSIDHRRCRRLLSSSLSLRILNDPMSHRDRREKRTPLALPRIIRPSEKQPLPRSAGRSTVGNRGSPCFSPATDQRLLAITCSGSGAPAPTPAGARLVWGRVEEPAIHSVDALSCHLMCSRSHEPSPGGA